MAVGFARTRGGNLQETLDQTTNDLVRRQKACIHAEALIAHQDLQSSETEKTFEQRFLSGDISIDELDRLVRALYPEGRMSGQQYLTWEDYLYPHSSVLRNKLGFTGQAALRGAEADLSKMRLRRLFYCNPLEATFNSLHYMALHAYIFRDVFDWAGEFRNVEMGKGATLFCSTSHIEKYLRWALEGLKEERYLVDSRVMSSAHDLHFTSVSSMPFTRFAKGTDERRKSSFARSVSTQGLRSIGR